jgi:hypothetical protein
MDASILHKMIYYDLGRFYPDDHPMDYPVNMDQASDQTFQSWDLHYRLKTLLPPIGQEDTGRHFSRYYIHVSETRRINFIKE